MLEDIIQFERKNRMESSNGEPYSTHGCVHVHVRTQSHTHLYQCTNLYSQSLINQVVHLTITALST